MDFTESNKQKTQAIAEAKQVLSSGSSDCSPSVRLKAGDRIKLAGKTLKGKNRIDRHGPLYEIKRVDSSVECLSAPGYFISSVITGDTRWIKQEDDLDFDIR